MIRVFSSLGAELYDEGAFTDVNEALVMLDLAGAKKVEAYVHPNGMMIVEEDKE